MHRIIDNRGTIIKYASIIPCSIPSNSVMQSDMILRLKPICLYITSNLTKPVFPLSNL